mgnify:CR=1 FL=1
MLKRQNSVLERAHQLEVVLLALRKQGPSLQDFPKEPKLSLPTKFDENRSQFRGSLNQVCLVIQMHLHRYPRNVSRVGLVRTLVIGIVYHGLHHY